MPACSHRRRDCELRYVFGGRIDTAVKEILGAGGPPDMPCQIFKRKPFWRVRCFLPECCKSLTRAGSSFYSVRRAAGQYVWYLGNVLRLCPLFSVLGFKKCVQYECVQYEWRLLEIHRVAEIALLRQREAIRVFCTCIRCRSRSPESPASRFFKPTAANGRFGFSRFEQIRTTGSEKSAAAQYSGCCKREPRCAFSGRASAAGAQGRYFRDPVTRPSAGCSLATLLQLH